MEMLINQVWLIYDKDGSGNLDKDETRLFIKEYMEQMGFEDTFNEEVYSAMFREFDDDGSGVIEKKEMKDFIQKIMFKKQPMQVKGRKKSFKIKKNKKSLYLI